MAKMYIMQGLPASGKSTKAKEIVQRDGNTVRLNRDLIRKMLHFGHWSGGNESLTKQAQRAMAKSFLESGENVIIDDTNLNIGTVQSWKDLAIELGAKFEIVKIDTPMDLCINRNSVRPDEERVPESVIVSMAMKAGLYPTPKKGIVICDIDGTIADISHRLHFVKNIPEGQKKDWKGFFGAMADDAVYMSVIDQVMELEGEGYDIFFVTGRPEQHREVTETWLEKTFNGYQPHKALFMRPEHNSKPDDEIKQKIYDDHFKKYDVHVVIDDRPSVIRMWKSNGLNIIDVGNGEEF